MPNPICEPTSTTAKRQKPANHRRQPPLLPGLTDDVAVQCLSLVHPSFLFSVCRSWRCLVYSPSFPPFLSLYTLLSPRPDHDDYKGRVLSPPTTTTNSEKWGSDSSQDPDPVPSAIHLFCFDPISARWQRLPPPPFRPLIRHPSFLSATFPIQSVATAVRLVIVASTAAKFLPALSRPLVFTPSSRRWSLGPPLDTPRRWCAAGTAGGAIFAASGVGSHYRNDVARSLEKWTPSDDNKRNCCYWEKRKSLKDAKFSREAIDAVGWRGKLCLVNVKGDAAKQGAIYDIAGDEWEEMPEGMVGGWRGPAAAMDEDVIYGINESRGSLRRYDPGRDAWEEVVAGDNRLRRGAEHIAAGGGRVCVVCCGGEAILVVDVAATPAKVWTVEPPVGFQAVAVHILPRVKDVDTWL